MSCLTENSTMILHDLNGGVLGRLDYIFRYETEGCPWLGQWALDEYIVMAFGNLAIMHPRMRCLVSVTRHGPG